MKEKIYHILQSIQKMDKKYELKTLAEKTDSIFEQMDKFTLKILFVGGFSAGKSALINALIKEELLTEGQRPETAIASEIIYDTKGEYIEAVSEDNKKSYTIAEREQIDIKEWDYLIWHLKREELERYNGCSIVDMPGFNSGLQEHNKAILRYAGRGNAYILVIDCEDGSIKQNMVDFMEEIRHYDNNIAIAVTKTDLKVEEDVAQIEDNIRIHAEMLLGNPVSVITTSKYDDFASEKLGNLIRSFDQENIFLQEFVPQVYEAGNRCIDSMETYKKGLQLDLSQFDKEIEKHGKAKQELIDKLKKEKIKLEKQFKNSVEPSIIEDIRSALYNHADDLAKHLKEGEKSFSMRVNSILRPVLLNSTQQYVEQSFESFIEEIDFSSTNASFEDISANVVDKYKQTNSKIQQIFENGDKLNVAYKALTTTLAVVTSAVAPWMELIIIFLPDILKLFGRRNEEDKLRNKVHEIIPEIVEKMRPEIHKSLIDMREAMLQQAEAEIKSLIDGEVESLQSAKENKEKVSMDYNQKVQEVEQDINTIKDLLGQIA